MNKYIPFLKLKAGEFGAIKTLDNTLKINVSPFFDFPYDKKMKENEYIATVGKLIRKFELNLVDIPYCYVDNFDVNSSLMINGETNYKYLLTNLSFFKIIPVVAIDRSWEHNQAVLNLRKSKIIKSKIVAFRLVREDFKNYNVISTEIKDELTPVFNEFDKIDLVLDCRVCLNINTDNLAKEIVSFANSFCSEYRVRKIIVTGSSIPSSIAEIVKSNSELTLLRKELIVHKSVYNKLHDRYNIFLGDYCTVSPDYSEIDIEPEMMPNVTAPKIIYSHGEKHYIQRGGALKTHHRGYLQYNDLSKILVSKSFFRGKNYSFGGDFFYQKSLGIGSKVQPGSVIKPSVNAHISYMMKDYP